MLKISALLRWPCGLLLLALAVTACTDGVGPGRYGDCNPATTDRWTYLGPRGETVTSMAETPWGLFVGTFDSGIFRCDAGSGRWIPMGVDGSVPHTMLFVPGPTPRLLAGVRWRYDEKTPAAVFATEDGRSFRPFDGGLAERQENRAWAFSLAMDPGDPQRLYMGQSAPIARSVDGGESWEYVFLGPGWGGGSIRALLVSPARDGRVWAGGKTSLGSGVVVASEDWGDTWEQFLVTPVFGNYVLALAVDPAQTSRLWAGALGGVMRSDDHGRSWAYVSPPLPGEYGASITGLILDGGDLYASGVAFRGPPDYDSALLFARSRDGGDTWELLDVPDEANGSSVMVRDGQGRFLIGTGLLGGGVWRFTP